ncbi:MAG: carbohydrate ABC transporter permease [Clostridia bacterium]|nr:carbohydrate ABC transporter permease [Clostridia bacterium]
MAKIVTMHERDIEKTSRIQTVRSILGTIMKYAFLLLVAVAVLFPFYWMINSSLKTLAEYKRTVPTFWPEQVMWTNYLAVFESGELGELFGYTLQIGLISTVASLVLTILTAFVFARLEFKGKNVLFAGLLATMMIPGELFTISNYTTVTQLGMITNDSVLIVPFLVSVFYVYLLRQNFMQIPNELYLAAKVDGTSDLKYLWKVMIPLALPTIISITILKMMGAWNSYIWPQLVEPQLGKSLITNGLLRMGFQDASGQTDFPKQMAAVALVSAPLFAVFIFFRKYIMKGVSRSGIKG